jgi:ABC-type multidrug transport system fused ATPase/permease subunit
MKILSFILERFFSSHKYKIIGLLLISLALSFIYTNISSKINAKIIESVQLGNTLLSFQYFWYITIVFFVYLLILFLYRTLHNSLSNNLCNWVKQTLYEVILRSNNENMRNLNFADFITPLTRISFSMTNLLSDLISNHIPTVCLMIVIISYFLYNDLKLGIGFLLGNIVILIYLIINWKTMFEYKQKQERLVVENERYILDSFNNIDKIIYRGMVDDEIKTMNDKTNKCIDFSISMTQYVTNHTLIMNCMAYVVILSTIYYILYLRSKNKITTLTVITFLTILIIYRDSISDTIQSVPYNLDLLGRIDLVVSELEDMVSGQDIIKIMDDNKYNKSNIPFDSIEFQDVSFKYKSSETPILVNYSNSFILNNKIIGIVGKSGKGKSSFIKLILRIHDCDSGKIMLDGKDITTIDPNEIRNNITYINQNSRLFDREILTNILYGCKDESKCSENLKEILSFEKIRELYKNIDFNGDAGPLGENLSGGQRQVTNLISGLINTTPILILDEPTNALDPKLKSEIISLIQYFRSNKKCIMIITHDKDVHSLFDETIEI